MWDFASVVYCTSSTFGTAVLVLVAATDMTWKIGENFKHCFHDDFFKNVYLDPQLVTHEEN